MEEIIKQEGIRDEQLFTFKESDRKQYGVLNYDDNEIMAQITGFDLQVSFNMRLIHSLADVEACTNALADVFYEALLEQLIATNPSIIQQVKEK